ncbi:hypothetical protein, partial [Dolosicoccus paucivorans]
MNRLDDYKALFKRDTWVKPFFTYYKKALFLSRPPKVRPKNLTFGGIFMTKYSLETKLQIVTDYEAGKGGFRT